MKIVAAILFFSTFWLKISNCFEFLSLAIEDEAEACATPDGIQGECIDITKCESLLNLLKKRPLLPQVLDHLRQSVCNFDNPAVPKVCCPKFPFKRVEVAPIKTLITITTTTTTTAPEGVKLPPLDRCGISTKAHQRIVGGYPSELNAWPWIAALGYLVGLILNC